MKKVVQLGKPYNQAVEELKTLLEQKDDYKKDQLWEIFQYSDRDYKQVINFLKTPIGEWDDEDWQPLWRHN